VYNLGEGFSSTNGPRAGGIELGSLQELRGKWECDSILVRRDGWPEGVPCLCSRKKGVLQNVSDLTKGDFSLGKGPIPQKGQWRGGGDKLYFWFLKGKG